MDTTAPPEALQRRRSSGCLRAVKSIYERPRSPPELREQRAQRCFGEHLGQRDEMQMIGSARRLLETAPARCPSDPLFGAFVARSLMPPLLQRSGRVRAAEILPEVRNFVTAMLQQATRSLQDATVAHATPETLAQLSRTYQDALTPWALVERAALIYAQHLSHEAICLWRSLSPEAHLQRLDELNMQAIDEALDQNASPTHIRPLSPMQQHRYDKAVAFFELFVRNPEERLNHTIQRSDSPATVAFKERLTTVLHHLVAELLEDAQHVASMAFLETAAGTELLVALPTIRAELQQLRQHPALTKILEDLLWRYFATGAEDL